MEPNVLCELIPKAELDELKRQNRVYRDALEHIRYQLEMIHGYEARREATWKTATKALDEGKGEKNGLDI